MHIPIQVLDRALAGRPHLQVNFDFEESEMWLRPPSSEIDGTVSVATPSHGTLQLFLHADLASLLSRGDNAGERKIVAAVLDGLTTEPAALQEREKATILERAAPLGRKKHLLLLPAHTRPELARGAGLPEPRLLQSPDEAWTLDEIGAALRATGLTEGDIPETDRGTVLNQTVEFAFRRLQAHAQTLSSTGLLEWFIAHNEALLRSQAERELTVPTRLECYSSVATIEDELKRELPRRATSAIASRFLIEYLVASPPRGLRPMSLSFYDTLMALAEEIVTKGMMSDAVRFELADHKLSILPSGRLGIDREGLYERGRQRFLPAYARGEIWRNIQGFDRHWRASTKSASPPPEHIAIDEAATDEFGFRLSELLAFLTEMWNVGSTIDQQVKRVKRSELIVSLSKRLDWSEESTTRATALFSLGERASYLSPAPPFSATDIYPWRFNRALSYIRKPLLERGDSVDPDIMWGNRHLLLASRHLAYLCLGGRLKARSAAMRTAIGTLRDQAGEEFNDLVADAFSGGRDLVVRSRVTKVGRQKIKRATGEDLGDIDVLVANKSRRLLLAVEAKNLGLARTPAEMANELEKTFGTGRVPSTAADRHLERTDWLDRHREEVLDDLGLASAHWKKWRVKPLIVVDSETMSTFISNCPISVMTLMELSRDNGASAFS